jgi:hypothetical protein
MTKHGTRNVISAVIGFFGAFWMAGGVAVIASGVAWGAIASAGGAPSHEPSVTQDAPNPYDSMPDRVGVVDRHTGQPVGTVSKADLMGHPHELERPVMDVLDSKGRLVGHLVPGIGFVSLAESSAPGYDPGRLRDEYPTTTVTRSSPDSP